MTHIPSHTTQAPQALHHAFHHAFHLAHERTIDAPADHVWTLMADYTQDSTWRTGVVSMTVTPPGLATVGALTAEELRFAGRTWRNEGIVTEVDAGQRFSWRTTSGADAAGARSVEALDERRCRARLELTVTPHGVERLVRRVLARMLQRNLVRDLDALAARVEAQLGAGSVSSTQSSIGVGTGSSSVAAASATASAKTASAAAYSAPPMP
jgi:uncharacterized membrane protein